VICFEGNTRLSVAPSIEDVEVRIAIGEGGGGLLSVSPTGTYYICAFDGRLVAEYNGLGICVRDYITMGGKLIALPLPRP